MTFLKRLFGPGATPVALVEHPLLGVLRYDPESETWGKLATVAGREVRLSVTGQGEPNPKLLDQLVAFESGLREFLPLVRLFLDRSVGEMRGLDIEVRALVVEEVGFWWPERPDAAMVWFKGPSERLWHCDYDTGTLSSLAYDD